MLLKNTPEINDQTDDPLGGRRLRTRRWHACTSDTAWCRPRSQHTSSGWPRQRSEIVLKRRRAADLGCATDGACPGTADNWRLPVERPVSRARGWTRGGALGGDLWGRALGLGRVHGGVMPGGGRSRGRAGCGEGEEGGRGEESGDAATYLKVVGIISIKSAAGDQPAHLLLLGVFPSVRPGLHPSAPSPVARRRGTRSCLQAPSRTVQHTDNEDYFFTRASRWIPELKLAGGQKFGKPDRPSNSNRRGMQSDRCRRPIRLSNANVQKRMVQTRQNYPLPAPVSLSARSARLSRQCASEIRPVTQKTGK